LHCIRAGRGTSPGEPGGATSLHMHPAHAKSVRHWQPHDVTASAPGSPAAPSSKQQKQRAPVVCAVMSGCFPQTDASSTNSETIPVPNLMLSPEFAHRVRVPPLEV